MPLAARKACEDCSRPLYTCRTVVAGCRAKSINCVTAIRSMLNSVCVIDSMNVILIDAKNSTGMCMWNATWRLMIQY